MKLIRIKARCNVIVRISENGQVGSGVPVKFDINKEVKLNQSQFNYLKEETDLFRLGVLFPAVKKEFEDFLRSEDSIDDYALCFTDNQLEINLKGEKSVDFVDFLETSNAPEVVLKYVEYYMNKHKDTLGTKINSSFVDKFNVLLKKQLYTLA